MTPTSARSGLIDPAGPLIRFMWWKAAAISALAGWWLAARPLSEGSGAWGLLPIALALVLAARAARAGHRRGGESEEGQMLRSIVENLGEGVAVADARGRLILFNPTARSIMGQDRTDSGPEEWSAVYGLYQPDGVTPMAAEELPLARALAGEECREVEMFVRNPRRRGGVFIRVTATPLKDRDGKITGGVAVFRDITHRRFSETVLRDSAARFRSIVDSTPAALIIVSPTRSIVEFNPEAERIFERERADALGENFLDSCLPAEYRDAVARDIDRALAEDSAPSIETRLVGSRGAVRMIQWTFSRLTDARGETEAALAIGHDVTIRRETEAALRVRELAAHLQSARESERKHVAREIHDELGQALTGLKFEVSFLARKSADNADLRERLDRIGSMIDETIGTVRGIAAELRPQVLDQLGLCEAIRWQAQEFARRTEIECATSLPTEPLVLTADLSIALFRILQETLTNVARHAAARSVSIRLQRDAEKLILEIADDGCGVSTSDITDIRSFGLLGMMERVRIFNGTFRISRGESGGTVVRVEIPEGS